MFHFIKRKKKIPWANRYIIFMSGNRPVYSKESQRVGEKRNTEKQKLVEDALSITDSSNGSLAEDPSFNNITHHEGQIRIAEPATPSKVCWPEGSFESIIDDHKLFLSEPNLHCSSWENYFHSGDALNESMRRNVDKNPKTRLEPEQGIGEFSSTKHLSNTSREQDLVTLKSTTSKSPTFISGDLNTRSVICHAHEKRKNHENEKDQDCESVETLNLAQNSSLVVTSHCVSDTETHLSPVNI